MEAITHILTGILIQVLCFVFFPLPFNLILTIVLGFFSHFLIDALAKITYHTPAPHPEDKFWVAWHVITPLLVVVLIVWGILINKLLFFLIGGISANLVDIWDWGILRPIQSKKKKENPDTTWGEKYFIHDLIDKLRKGLFSWLPNLNHEKKGVIPETLLIIVLWILAWWSLGFLPSA